MRRRQLAASCELALLPTRLAAGAEREFGPRASVRCLKRRCRSGWPPPGLLLPVPQAWSVAEAERCIACMTAAAATMAWHRRRRRPLRCAVPPRCLLCLSASQAFYMRHASSIRATSRRGMLAGHPQAHWQDKATHIVPPRQATDGRLVAPPPPPSAVSPSYLLSAAGAAAAQLAGPCSGSSHTILQSRSALLAGAGQVDAAGLGAVGQVGALALQNLCRRQKEAGRQASTGGHSSGRVAIERLGCPSRAGRQSRREVLCGEAVRPSAGPHPCRWRPCAGAACAAPPSHGPAPQTAARRGGMRV